MSEVIVVIGAGSIGQAVARRVSAGKHVVLADLNPGNADAAAEVMRDAGFDVSTATVDVSLRESRTPYIGQAFMPMTWEHPPLFDQDVRESL
ncbi:MAG: saccharopine dehydrogenase NADP-binding domain-containing protein [Acidimicrobiales bacterium]